MGKLKNSIKFSYPLLYKGLKVVIHPLQIYQNYKKGKAEKKLIEEAPALHKVALAKLKNKKNIRCVFFVFHHQVWKYDYLYKLMCDSSRFTPMILVCPVLNGGEENLQKRMDDAYNYFKGKSYEVIKAYNQQEGKYIDVKQTLSPDIIFYTNPYEKLIGEKLFVKSFADTLTVYVPYAFDNNKDHQLSEDLLLRNLVWRCYVETEEFQMYAKKYARNEGRNILVTGYPGIDPMLIPHINITTKCWKRENLKRIIWAPHHTIEAVGNVYYSCFLQYADFMVTMAQKYQDQICFVFKPHPLLREKLYHCWGESRTTEYYQKWENMPNTSINDDDYTNLFLTSDAMIHDCGSFITEYLYTRKPVMRMMNNIPIDSMFNDFTKKCLDVYYKAYKKSDIEQFLLNVIDGVDPLKEARDIHYKDYLLPPHGKIPSENILEDIIDSIDNQILYKS